MRETMGSDPKLLSEPCERITARDLAPDVEPPQPRIRRKLGI